MAKQDDKFTKEYIEDLLSNISDKINETALLSNCIEDRRAYTYLSLNEDKSSVEILINVEIEENKTNKFLSSVKKAVRTKVEKYVESKDPEYTIHKYAGFNLKEFKGYRVNFIFMDEE
jgi:predicted metal-dependent hydrolase